MGVGFEEWAERDREQRVVCVERGDRAKETREMCKKGDKKRGTDDRRKAEIPYLNEQMREGEREREGGRASELIMGLCCRDKAELHPG